MGSFGRGVDIVSTYHVQSNIVGVSSPGHNKSRLGSQNFIVPIDLGIMGSIHKHCPAKRGGKLHKLLDCLFTDNRWSCTAPVRLGLVTVG